MPRRTRRRRPRQTISKRIKKAMREVAFSTQETKHHRRLDTLSVAQNGSMIALNSVDSQGVQSGQFIGQEIRQIGIRFRALLFQSDSHNVVRVMFVTPSTSFQSDLDAGLVTPNDIFYQPVSPLLSPLVESKVKKVYSDRLLTLNIASGQNDQLRVINKWINLKMKKYTLQDGTPNMPGQDKVYVAVFSDSALAGHPTLDYHSCLYYKDA